MDAQSLNHWTSRKVQEACIFIAHWAPQILQLALASWKLHLEEVCRVLGLQLSRPTR